MRQKSGLEGSAEEHVKEIRRKTRRKFSAEEKIRILLENCFLPGDLEAQSTRSLATTTTSAITRA